MIPHCYYIEDSLIIDFEQSNNMQFVIVMGCSYILNLN